MYVYMIPECGPQTVFGGNQCCGNHCCANVQSSKAKQNTRKAILGDYLGLLGATWGYIGYCWQVEASLGKWAGDRKILKCRHLGYWWLGKASQGKSMQV